MLKYFLLAHYHNYKSTALNLLRQECLIIAQFYPYKNRYYALFLLPVIMGFIVCTRAKLLLINGIIKIKQARITMLGRYSFAMPDEVKRGAIDKQGIITLTLLTCRMFRRVRMVEGPLPGLELNNRINFVRVTHNIFYIFSHYYMGMDRFCLFFLCC